MIHELMAKLTDEQRRGLLYALELGTTRWVVIGNKFIGVNMNKLNKDFKILDEINKWSCGDILK